MDLALPIAVQFMGQGNKELERNMTSYLSLAAIDNAQILAANIKPVIDSDAKLILQASGYNEQI